MNYLAHGYRFLTEPYVLAGSAVPDWLGAAQRATRLDRRALEAPVESGPRADLLRGILQHLADDRWFHQTPAFLAVTAELGARIRARFPAERELRASFLGHILTELLLDAHLARLHATLVDDYYAVLKSLDPGVVEALTNGWLLTPTADLAPFIRRFLDWEYLRTYENDSSLVGSLNGIMTRAELDPVPAGFEELLPEFRALVSARAAELLPPPDPMGAHAPRRY